MRDSQAQILMLPGGQTPVCENQTQRLSEETHASREAKTLVFEGQSSPDGRLIRLQILSTNQAQRLSDETCKRCMTGTGTLHSNHQQKGIGEFTSNLYNVIL